jgi:hypothetical protein
VGKERLILFAAALNLAIAGAACSSARGNEEAGDGRASGSGETMTVAGCLTGSPDGRFALTATPDATVAAAERAVSDERTTHIYTLIGGTDLQSHVGKRVEVVGTISGREQEIDHDAKKKTEATPAAGGGEKPSVTTKEEVEVEARQLHVQQVRPLDGNCKLTP